MRFSIVTTSGDLMLSVLIGWTLTSTTTGQDLSPPKGSQQPTPGHWEVPNDPYLPAPPRRPGGGPRGGASPVMRGPWRSIQVNIDADGNNIPDDAANEPSIAIDPTDPNKIVIGWRQFDTITNDFRQAGWAYSHDAGQSWTFPGSLTPGVFGSDPVLDCDANGGFYYVNINFERVRLFRSFDAGVTWDGPIEVLAGFHDKEWMVIDRTGGIGQGNIYMAWTGSDNFTRSIDGGLTFMPPIPTPVGNTLWSTMSIGPDGEVFITDRTFHVTRSTDAQDPAVATPTFDPVGSADMGAGVRYGAAPNPGGLSGQVNLATDHSTGASRGNVYLLASVGPLADDPLDVMFSRSTDGGQTWSPAVRVNNDPAGEWNWFGTMSVAPTGRIDVVWNDTRTSGQDNLSELYYAYSYDMGDTWSAGMPVSPMFDSLVGHPVQEKIGDYYHMRSDVAAANLAYSATFNGEQDVYFIRLGDCNENGSHDSLDIAGGLSEDCNGNGIPDECESEAGDIEVFVSQLLAEVPDPSLLCLLDQNGDGVLDGLDIQLFVDSLLGP